MHGPTLASTKVTLKPKSLNFSQRGKICQIGPWCGQAVSVLAFYSGDPSSNATEVYNFSEFFCWKEHTGISPFLKFRQIWSHSRWGETNSLIFR